MNNSLISNQFQKDRQNAVGAKATSNDSGQTLQRHKGKITAVNSNGSYQVGLLGGDGETVVKTFDGIFVLGDDTEKAVDTVVVLEFEGNKHPYILSTGSGGSSTCAIQLNNFGVLYG